MHILAVSILTVLITAYARAESQEKCSDVLQDVWYYSSTPDKIKIAGTMDSVQMDNTQECIDLCNRYADCKFWVYLTDKYSGSSPPMHCSIYKNYHTSFQWPGANSGARDACKAKAACYRDDGGYYYGNPNIFLDGFTEPALCQTACQGIPKCHVWTLTKHGYPRVHACRLVLSDDYNWMSDNYGSYIAGPKYCPGTCIYDNLEYKKFGAGEPTPAIVGEAYAAKTPADCLAHCQDIVEGASAWLFEYSRGKKVKHNRSKNGNFGKGKKAGVKTKWFGKGKKAGVYRNCRCQKQVGDEAKGAVRPGVKTVGGDIEAARTEEGCLAKIKDLQQKL